MIGVQAGASFVLWLAYGALLWRRAEAIRERSAGGTRTVRALQAAAMLFGGAAMLLSGLYGIESAGGFGPNGMAAWAWAAVTVLGLAFVHLQTLAAAKVVLLAQESVTPGGAATSTSQESEKARNDDA